MPIEPVTFMGGERKGGSGGAIAPGVYVSLNLERRKLLATSGGELLLTYANPTGQVPPDIKDKDLVHLQAALERGDIVLGQGHIRPQPRRSIMDPVFDEVDSAGDLEAVKPLVFRITSRQKHLGGLAPAEALRYMIAHESEKRCRPEFLNFMGKVMDRTGGHSGVTEDLQESSIVKIPVDKDGHPIIKEITPERTPEQREAIRNLI
jgi:hypothetical protein